MRLVLAVLLLASPAAAADLDLTWRPIALQGPLPGDLEACTAAHSKRGGGIGLVVAGGLLTGGGAAALASALAAHAEGDEARGHSLGGLSAGLLTLGIAAVIGGPATIAAANKKFVLHDCANLQYPKTAPN